MGRGCQVGSKYHYVIYKEHLMDHTQITLHNLGEFLTPLLHNASIWALILMPWRTTLIGYLFIVYYSIIFVQF